MKTHTLLIVTVMVGLLSAGCSKQVAGQNRVLFEYLGEPVPLSANTDAAYTKAGLTGALQDAAQAASVTLTEVEIDDSEFPPLVGVV